YDSRVQGGRGGGPATAWRYRVSLPVGSDRFEAEAVGRDDMNELAIEPEDGPCLRLAQVQCLRRNGINNGLDVGRPARNGPQDFRRGPLPPQAVLRALLHGPTPGAAV